MSKSSRLAYSAFDRRGAIVVGGVGLDSKRCARKAGSAASPFRVSKRFKLELRAGGLKSFTKYYSKRKDRGTE